MPTRTPTRTPTRALSQHDEPVSIKLLVLGVASVGKSSLLLRFTDQQWLSEEETNPTIGVDTLVHKLDVKGRRVVLNIWDTAGDERLRAITSSYYRGTQGIIIVYDVTNRESFNTISWWFAERSKYAPEQAVKMIVGNKSDKGHMRQVPTAEGAAYAARMGCLFVESSAKSNVGVREAFRDVVERTLNVPGVPRWPVDAARLLQSPKSIAATLDPSGRTGGGHSI